MIFCIHNAKSNRFPRPRLPGTLERPSFVDDEVAIAAVPATQSSQRVQRDPLHYHGALQSRRQGNSPQFVGCVDRPSRLTSRSIALP